MKPTKEEFVRKWRPHLLGMAVMPRPVADMALHGRFVSDALKDVHELLAKLYDDANGVPAANGKPTEVKA